MRLPRRVVSAVAVLFVLAAPGAAIAEEDAQALFHRGAQAYQEGRYEDAVDLFLTVLVLSGCRRLPRGNFRLGFSHFS
jgi:hypothetical protein